MPKKRKGCKHNWQLVWRCYDCGKRHFIDVKKIRESLDSDYRSEAVITCKIRGEE